jgi:hypothetical protein
VRHWRTLGVSPPGKGASEIERLRFVRDLSVRSLAYFGPIMLALFFLFQMPLWAFIVLAATFLFQAVSILRLTQRIRAAGKAGFGP